MKDSKHYHYLRLFIIYGLLITLFCGCTTIFKRTDSSSVLEPQGIPKFLDIPVPGGFKLLPRESYTFESAGVRVGVLKYKGRAQAESIVNFYKDQMPLYNWNLLNLVEYGERLLNFDREDETCIIRLTTGSFKALTLTISIGPKSRTTLKKPGKKADKPVK